MKTTPLNIKRHPLSALFSRCDLLCDDLQTLADDIQANGQLLPITIFEGMILDGWNRYLACQMAKVKPFTMPLAPGVDPWDFVKGVNMFRRHMSPAERVAVMLLHAQMGGQNVSQGDSRSKLTTRQIEADIEVSRGTAVKAGQIARAQDPALNEALADKRISLDQAADLAKLPEAERKTALEAPTPPAKAPKAEKEKPGACPSCKAMREELDQLVSESQANNEEFQSYIRVLDADDKLAKMRDEVKRFAAMNRVLQERLNGKMSECVALAKDATRWMRKAEKLEKQLKALDKDDTFKKGA